MFIRHALEIGLELQLLLFLTTSILMLLMIHFRTLITLTIAFSPVMQFTTTMVSRGLKMV